MFWQSSGNVQISDVNDAKTAIILIKFLINQNEINGTFI